MYTMICILLIYHGLSMIAFVKNTVDANKVVNNNQLGRILYEGHCHRVSTFPRWTVYLNSIYRINHITFFFTSIDYTPSFRGLYVYISNTTEELFGTLCYNDNSFSLDTMSVGISMPRCGSGKYITLFSEIRQCVNNQCLVPLCDSLVYGCPKVGYYNGSACCPSEKCQRCNLDTGTCLVCQPGYQGVRCEQDCDKGMYGHECNGTCGHCDDLHRCSPIDGTCLNGCDAGYQGEFCITICDKGAYGDGCNGICGHCRDVNQCSNIKGTCLTGCKVGYQGELCNEDCDKGMYGHECNETCGHCNVDRCSPINGTCLDGCDAGYLGDFCTTKCGKGTYGDGCNETCGHCRDVNKCSNINGTCLTGCSVGYQGELCNEGGLTDST